MVSLVAVYHTPHDPEAFMEHYRQIHLPIAQGLPGLASLRFGHPKTLGGQGLPDAPFLVAEMCFADRPTLERALLSEASRQATRDLEGFAHGLYVMKVVEWQ